MIKPSLLISIVIALCLYSNIGLGDTVKAELDAKVINIKSRLEHAKSSNMLWRDTEILYQSAQQMINKKDYISANKILDEVQYQLLTAEQQATQQKNSAIIPLYLQSNSIN